MTLNDIMAVMLRYFTEFGKPALQKTICGGIYARVYCIFSACTMSSQRKFTFAISSPDEFLVSVVVIVIVANLTNKFFFLPNYSSLSVMRIPTDRQTCIVVYTNRDASSAAHAQTTDTAYVRVVSPKMDIHFDEI